MQRDFSQHKLRFILEVIPIPMAIADTDGNIEFFNKAFIDLFGYDVEDIPTTQVWFEKAYHDEHDREKVIKARQDMAEIFSRSGYAILDPLELAVTCKNGTICQIEARAILIEGLYLAVFHDVSEQKRNERALKESEQLFRAVFNGAKDGMIVTDVETKAFRLANKAIQSMLGYSEEEFFGLTVSDIHPPDALKAVINYIEGKSPENIPPNVHVPLTKKDGEVLFSEVTSGNLIVNGRPAKLGIFRDSSERKKYQEDIIRERDFSHAVLESLPGIFYMFDEEGRFLRWNENFKKVTGYSDEEIEKLSHLDLFPEEDASFIKDRIDLCFIKGETDAEADLVAKDGNRTPYYWTGMLSTIGGETCVVGMGIDISRRKQAEKMQALGQLAGGIAHDFNNQLGAILGFAEILSQSIDDTHLRNHALMIAEAATRASDLTRKLLAFARKGKYQTGPVDINRSTKEIVALLSHSIDKRITIKTDFIQQPTFIQGDATQIHHALLNLAVNARDAMADGGILTFSTHHETLNKAFCMEASFDITPGRYVRIEVRDTGTGIEQDVQHRIYEPFFTTKEQGEGTGMGLPAVYGTVKNHKGAISFQSEPGKGSVFSLYFPLIDAPVKPDTPEEKPVKIKTENLVILVVDDEEMIRIVTSDILSALGYQVILCNDGRAAIECYLEKGHGIDLVILDLMMPEIDGFDTFAQLKKIDPDIKVILASGYSMDGQIQELLDQGALDFIQKPFTVRQLSTSLARVFAS